MTKEEAIYLLSQVNHILVNSDSWLVDTHEPLNTAFNMAIKALEQESCEDCISRQAVIDKAVYTETEEGWSGMTVDVKDIEALPPVNPQNSKRETAKWIRRSDIMSWKWFECSKCKTGNDSPTSYCPHCGCEMKNSETTYTTSAKEESKKWKDSDGMFRRGIGAISNKYRSL